MTIKKTESGEGQRYKSSEATKNEGKAMTMSRLPFVGNGVDCHSAKRSRIAMAVLE